MPTLVIGDLHGQVELADKALEIAAKQSLDLVFIGDYLDSFARSVEDQVATLKLVLDAVREGGGNTTGLLGNHELSYTMERMRCSGFKVTTKLHVEHMDISPLKNYVFKEGFLISHAGVSKNLLDATRYSLQEYLDNGEFFQIGQARGGRDRVGGLFWCDWRYEFEPLEEQPQIVGHTRGDLIRQKGNSYCIDVLEDTIYPQCAYIDNGEFHRFSLREGEVLG